MIIFRADGSNKIGAGHIMRCMTIADAFPDKERVLFVTCSEDSVPLINARGYKAVVLKTYEGKEALEIPIDKELKEFKAVLKENKPSFIMVDSYRATDDYLTELGKISTVGYIDDVGEHKYPVKLLLNYNALPAMTSWMSSTRATPWFLWALIMCPSEKNLRRPNLRFAMRSETC